MAGGLVQLIHQDANVRRPAAQEFIPIEPIRDIKWNSNHTFIFPRNADIIDYFKFSMRVGPAPEGYRWKRRWPYFLMKSAEFSIGGTIIWSTNTAMLQMQYLMHGSREPSAECIFDLDDTERTQRSKYAHEILFEPLRLHELTLGEYKIPMIRLAFHDVRLKIETGSLEDCLEPLPIVPRSLNNTVIFTSHIYIDTEKFIEVEREPIAVGPPPLPQAYEANNIIQTANLFTSYVYLDTEERRGLAQQPDLFHRTRHFEYESEVISPHANNYRKQKRFELYGVGSAAYVWITDAEGNELPMQALTNIEVKLNGETRQALTGFQSRHAVRNELPHPIIENTKSQNLYYLSYFSGRRNEDGAEQGINFRRIENYSLVFTFDRNIQQNIKIHTIHRTQAALLYMHGMAGLLNQERGFDAPVLTSEQKLQAMVFENPDKKIDIRADEAQCMITYVDFVEDDIVDQCKQCHKVFNKDALFNWLKTRQENQWKCVHCQGPYGPQHFLRGKAHLLEPGAQQVQAPEDVELEEAPLLRVPIQQPGFIRRIMNRIFCSEHEHQN